MTDPTPAAGGLTEALTERIYAERDALPTNVRAPHNGFSREDAAHIARALVGSEYVTEAADRELAPWASCTGATNCPETWHIHGCYADTGQCDDPLDHKPAADRELARVTAAVEALADEWEGRMDVPYPGTLDGTASTYRAAATALRAALSSADTTALDDLLAKATSEGWKACESYMSAALDYRLDRERAKAAGEALREAADAIQAVRENGLPEGVRSHPVVGDDWLRDRAAAVSPEGGDA